MARSIYALIATILFAAPAFAHDPKLHKGPKVEGTIVSLKGDKLVVQTNDDPVKVTLSLETSYEQGIAGEKATKSALKEGGHVMIFGHKLESGELVASEVMIYAHAENGEDSKPHGHADAEK